MTKAVVNLADVAARAASRFSGGPVRKSLWLLVGLSICVVASACSRSSSPSSKSNGASSTATTAAAAVGNCGSTPLQASDVGITATTITVEVMADVGSSLAP